MSNHVFISYAHADASDFARQLHDDLEKMGLSMWLDAEDIPKGANWALTIQRAIMTCRAFIFVITPASYESKVCNLELQQAWEDDRDLTILPVYCKTVDELPFLIKNINYTDCRSETAIGFKALFDEISKVPEGEATEESEIIVPDSVARSGANQAKIYTDADDVEFLAQVGLFGRDDWLKQIQTALTDDNARVLLQAFGGVGKTALAAQISYDWIEEKSEPVLWLRMGATDSEATFAALSHPFGASQAMAATPIGDKAKLLRDLIKGANIGLVILDDCWNGNTLLAIQKGIPRKVPVLVTARQTYPLTPILRIPDLPDDEALALLRRLAPTLIADEAAARALCQKLGNHAFAIEVAGRTMQAKHYTAKAFLADIKKTDITQLEVPLEYQQAGRESIAALIETTLNELPDAAKNVFVAWGAFWSPQITPELMMQYFVDTPDVSDEMIADARERVPDIADISDDEIRSMYEQILAKQPIDTQPAEDALNILQQYGLASRQNAQQTAEGRPLLAASYRLHDLGFEYAKAQNGDVQANQAVDACLSHIARHKEPSLENFAALDPNIDTYMAAASFAFAQGRYADVERFAGGLYLGADSQAGFFPYRGYCVQSITLLRQAVNAAKKIGDKPNQGVHLGNLGLTYRDLGQYEQAIEYHQQALSIAHEVGYKLGKGITLGNLGVVYHLLRQYEQAIEYLQQALSIAERINDIHGQGNWLCGLGNTYLELGQYEQGMTHYKRALAIAEKIDDRQGQATLLGNLGHVYADLGQHKQMTEHYQQALAISREIGDKRGEGHQLGNLGNTYIYSEQYDQTIEYYRQSLNIKQEIGDRLGESTTLNNLGVIYEHWEDYEQSISYYEQSLILRQALGVAHLIEQTERNLEIIRQKQAAQGKSDAGE